MGDGVWVLMGFFWIVLLVAIAWALVGLLRQRDERGLAHDDPGRILARRLAQGEIDVETYERLREKLQNYP